jgi:pimeloyl-ACP methyl ester carboxylesterase
VLVGHSLGGIHAQVFAHRYPDRVAGLVLVDPPPLPFLAGEAFPDLYRVAQQQTAEFEQTAQALRKAQDPAALARAGFLETLASENESLFAGDGAAQLAAIESFGDLPLVVVSSGRPNPAFGAAAKDFQQFWIEQNRTLATRSTRGRFLLAEESGHHVHVDAPDVVLDAVRQVLEEQRR